MKQMTVDELLTEIRECFALGDTVLSYEVTVKTEHSTRGIHGPNPAVVFCSLKEE